MLKLDTKFFNSVGTLPTPSSEESQVAKKFSMLAFTDFLCKAPIPIFETIAWGPPNRRVRRSIKIGIKR
jgi:hypothetical protein